LRSLVTNIVVGYKGSLFIKPVDVSDLLVRSRLRDRTKDQENHRLAFINVINLNIHAAASPVLYRPYKRTAKINKYTFSASNEERRINGGWKEIYKIIQRRDQTATKSVNGEHRGSFQNRHRLSTIFLSVSLHFTELTWTLHQ